MLIGDFTNAKADENRFMIWGSIAAQKYNMRWFKRHLPTDGFVAIRRFDMNLVGLSLAAPQHYGDWRVVDWLTSRG